MQIVKKLVRLNTNLRAQLEMEGWGNVGDEDGVLTEEELLEAARAQGVLKRSSSAWKYTAVLILALVGASFAIMLGLVVAGGILVRDTMTDSKSAIMATMNGQIVSVSYPIPWTNSVYDTVSAWMIHRLDHSGKYQTFLCAFLYISSGNDLKPLLPIFRHCRRFMPSLLTP